MEHFESTLTGSVAPKRVRGEWSDKESALKIVSGSLHYLVQLSIWACLFDVDGGLG